PPETATPELDEWLTVELDACSPDELLLEDDDVAVEVLVAAVLAVPGIVSAPMAPSKPTPTTALTAAPAVSRLSRRSAASRARTLSWIVSLSSMV
ncbi:MAG TPA: hypothetical protein VNO55_04360, partial [Polyangia bacterium]|nr:hypothetical protein [Polyangia bacterium]